MQQQTLSFLPQPIGCPLATAHLQVGHLLSTLVNCLA